MAISTDDERLASFNAFIADAIRRRTMEIVDEEVERCVESVRSRVAKETDKIALSVLSYYQIETRRDSLVITVSKEKL